MIRTRFTTQHPHSPRRGFSLIEILVVIAIIVLLAGITIGVGRRMIQSAKKSHTKIILGICKSASDAYATKFKPILHYSGNLDPTITASYVYEYNWDKTTFKKNAPDANGTGAINDPIERFVYKALKYETSSKILHTLNNKQLVDRDGDGFLEVYDGFDNKIKYAAYVSGKDAYTLDDTLPIHRTAFFASAGRDGKWGDANNSNDADAQDNMYSFDQD